MHKYIQSANNTSDEPIKKACQQKINRILLTYLSTNGWIKMKLIYIYIIFDMGERKPWPIGIVEK
jgi:hypothetical protein